MMSSFFESLHDATVLKRFLDELEKNPKRTLGALAAVVLLTGAGVSASYRVAFSKQPPLSELPTTPAVQNNDGSYQNLPQAIEAEKRLQPTLNAESDRNRAVLNELNSRPANAPVTEREIRLLNESGKVSH